VTPFDMEIWARTVLMEASGEGEEGMRAVAHAINNRFKAGKWFSGKTVSETCLFPSQFSCWNTSDPNRRRMAALPDNDSTLVLCRSLVHDVAAGLSADPTDGATHYYSTSMVLAPEWAKTGTMTKQIGRHKFYKRVA
jgi:N-acetylmuramoyl-L-alanine amidase